jgi:hypothetical protein
VPHLGAAARRGLGTSNLAEIEVRGMRLADACVPFLPARENAVGRTETLLRRSALRRLVFRTPLFTACLWAARRYYDVWSLRNARRCWARARAHPVYGPQWRHVGPGVRGTLPVGRRGAQPAT